MIAAPLLLLAASILSLNANALSIKPGRKYRQPTRARKIFDPQVLAGAPVNNISITATNVDQCAQAVISWTGAVNPVTLTIGIGGYYIGETTIMTMPNLPGPSTEWTVNQGNGTDLIFQITDANNTVAYIQNIQVAASPDGETWCLNSTAPAPDDGSDTSGGDGSGDTGDGAGTDSGDSSGPTDTTDASDDGDSSGSSSSYSPTPQVAVASSNPSPTPAAAVVNATSPTSTNHTSTLTSGTTSHTSSSPSVGLAAASSPSPSSTSAAGLSTASWSKFGVALVASIVAAALL